MGKTRVYELYCDAPGFGVTNQSSRYRSGMWLLEVKATSIKQAYFMAANQKFSRNGSLGIVFIDASNPRTWTWDEIPEQKPGWLKLAEIME